MKNPLLNLCCVLGTWRRMREHPGVFSLGDAFLHWNRILLPDRLHFRAAGRSLRREAVIEPVEDGVFRVSLPNFGLRFFWDGPPTDHLWYLVEQEFDTGNPHCYTTPPIQLCPQSLVIDVGACEGLFAFRVARAALARQVICFEPSQRMAELLRRGAEANGVGSLVKVEPLAASRQSGRLRFQAGPSAEAGRLSSGVADDAAVEVEAVCLDDYCRERGLRLGPRDLIKIDAEGADFDVLLGAERVIREGSPQIAVTTYHTDCHCTDITRWLSRLNPGYRLRLKGFAFWTPSPRPVLLQAASGPGEPRRSEPTAPSLA